MYYMKVLRLNVYNRRLHIGLMSLLIMSPAFLQANCHLTSNVNHLDYGQINQLTSTLYSGSLPLPARDFIIRVNCDEPKKVILKFDTATSKNFKFSWGNYGLLNVTLTSITADNKNINEFYSSSDNKLENRHQHGNMEITPNTYLAIPIEAKDFIVNLSIQPLFSKKKQATADDEYLNNDINISVNTQ